MRDTTPAPAHVVDSLQSRLGRSHLLRFLTALVLALLTWGWVIQATDPIESTTYTEMEIQAPELEDGLVMVTSLPRGSVKVEGPKSEVAKVSRTMLNLTVDTSQVTKPGEYRLPVVVESPDTSNRITAEPKTIKVQIDEVTNEVIPLEIKETSTENSTRVINTISPTVSQVTVSGPSSAVDRVDRVILPVQIDIQMISFSEYFIPYAVDENDQRVSEVTVLPGQILTRVELQSRGRVVTVIPNIVGQPAEGYSIQQRTVLPTSITVEGPEDALDDLLFINTEPVDITGASQSVSSRVGVADLPEGVTVVEPASGQIEVRVAIQDSSSSSSTLSNLPVNVLNVPDGYTARVEPESIDVSVQGSVTNLANMTSGDITVVVDVRDLDEGEHLVRPVVALPNNGVRSTGTNPDQVTVILEPINSTPEPTTHIPELRATAPATQQQRRRHSLDTEKLS